MSLQGSLGIERMCQLVPVSRRSFYRSLQEQQPVAGELLFFAGLARVVLVVADFKGIRDG